MAPVELAFAWIGYVIDAIAATVILTSALQAAFLTFGPQPEPIWSLRISIFVSGVLLALELESGNAILKAGLFVAEGSTALEGPFLYFVAILTVRIAARQALSRLSGRRRGNAAYSLSIT